MFVYTSINRHFLRRLQTPQVLTWVFLALALFSPGMTNAQDADSSEFDAALNQARTLVQSAVWNNRYDNSLSESVNLAMDAAETARAKWGEQDIRFRRAISVYAVAMSQHTLGLISRSEGDAAASAELVESMTTEAGSIAANETRDGELAMMATLVKARLARVTGDRERSMKLYDFVVQTLESMMAADHPILVAVKAERG